MACGSARSDYPGQFPNRVSALPSIGSLNDLRGVEVYQPEEIPEGNRAETSQYDSRLTSSSSHIDLPFRAKLSLHLGLLRSVLPFALSQRAASHLCALRAGGIRCQRPNSSTPNAGLAAWDGIEPSADSANSRAMRHALRTSVLPPKI
jgi:hypothetical protein